MKRTDTRWGNKLFPHRFYFMEWVIRKLEQIGTLELKLLRALLWRARVDFHAQIRRIFTQTQREDGTWSQEDLGFSIRNHQLDNEILMVLAIILAEAYETFLKYGEAGYRLGYYGMSWQMNLAEIASLSGADIRELLREPFIDATLEQRLEDLRAQYTTKLRRTFIQSQVEGEGLPALERRLAEILNGRGKSLRQALELLGVSEFWRAANMGIALRGELSKTELIGKQWLTADDERVCLKICAPVDNEIVKLNEDFSNGFFAPPAHANCRCVHIFIAITPTGVQRSYVHWADDRGIEATDDGRYVLL